LLSRIDFDKRYYAYYESVRHLDLRSEDSVVDNAILKKMLATSGLVFTFHKHGFFRHVAKREHWEFGLTIDFKYSSLEFIFYGTTPSGSVGGPYPGLAQEVAELRSPGFEFDPPYPKLPCLTEGELQSAVDFGIGMFRDVVALVLEFRSQIEG
jgi:hypothetical protein